MSSITSSRQERRGRAVDRAARVIGRSAVPADPRGQVREGVSVGVDDDGHSLLLPAEHGSVLISGDPGSGKSYLLGWFAEELIRRGMVTVVIDPEGDHTGLGRLEDVAVLDHPTVLTDRTVSDLIRERTSVVADLSRISGPERMECAAQIARVADLCRGRLGLPHWIMIDEAHDVLHHLARDLTSPAGYCLATYRPDELPAQLAGRITHRVSVTSRHLIEVQAASGDSRRAKGLPCRSTRHIRHLHKYLITDLPEARGFHFRDDEGRTGFVATNMRQLVDYLQQATDQEVVHHGRGGELSRWLRDVFHDDQLADATAEQEQLLRSDAIGAGQARRAIAEIVQRHYLCLS